MSNLSDPARNPRNWSLADRVQALEEEIQILQTIRKLVSASIGSGGLQVLEGGSITVDGGNITIVDGRLIAGDPDGARAEINQNGYRVFNEDNEVIIDLTTIGSNQLLLRGDGDDENEILLSANGAISGRSLNVEEITFAGQDLGAVLETLADAATPTSEGADEDPPPASGTITRTYDAVWSQAYRSNGNKNNFVPGDGLTQGFYSSLNGNQRSLIGFDSSAIQSDHSGRTITRVRIRLRFYHWFFNGGGTAILGHHGHSSEPAEFSATAIDVVRSENWPKPGTRTVRYPHSLQQWATGTKKGIVLGPGPSDSHLYYGAARAHNQSSPPRLEVRSIP